MISGLEQYIRAFLHVYCVLPVCRMDHKMVTRSILIVHILPKTLCKGMHVAVFGAQHDPLDEKRLE